MPKLKFSFKKQPLQILIDDMNDAFQLLENDFNDYEASELLAAVRTNLLESLIIVDIALKKLEGEKYGS